jgi:hypothetical protein
VQVVSRSHEEFPRITWGPERLILGDASSEGKAGRVIIYSQQKGEGSNITTFSNH